MSGRSVLCKPFTASNNRGCAHLEENTSISSDSTDTHVKVTDTHSRIATKQNSYAKVGSISSKHNKDAVNKWLGDIAVISVTSKEPWALLLETKELKTFRELESRGPGFCAARTVVPNPSISEVNAMLVNVPRLKAFTHTSHTLLAQLAKDCPDTGPRAELDRDKWPGCFDVVWLDYCGALNSRVGRQRQLDLVRLFRGEMLSHSLLAVTVSLRGTATSLYRSEPVDSLILLVQELARRSGRESHTLGVVSYRDKAPIYTVAFLITLGKSDGSNKQQMVNDIRRVSRTSAYALADTTTTIDICTDFEPLSLVQGLPAQLRLDKLSEMYHATALVAQEFSKLCTNVRRAIVLDNNALQVSRAMIKAVPACKVQAVLSDPQDQVAASAVIRAHPETHQGLNLQVCTTPMEIFETLAGSKGPHFDAIWLAYERKQPLKPHVMISGKCWQNVETALELDLLGLSSSESPSERPAEKILGVFVNIAHAYEIWKDYSVDMIVSGINKCCANHGLKAIVQFAATFSIGLARAVVVFNIKKCEDMSPPQTVVQSDNPPTSRAKKFTFHCGWDLERTKTPTRVSEKYETVRSRISRLLEDYEIESCILSEPGFFEILPYLHTSNSKCSVVCCVGYGHSIETKEVTRQALALGQKRSRPVISVVPALESLSDHFPSNRALILLVEGGPGAWRDLWIGCVNDWFQIAGSRFDGPLLLITMMQTTFGADGDEMLRQLLDRLGQIALASVGRQAKCIIHNQYIKLSMRHRMVVFEI